MRIAHMAALAALFAPAALAQQAGTYTGTNSQGQPFSVTVASQGGNLVITQISQTGLGTCRRGGTQIGVGLLESYDTPITDGKATVRDNSVPAYYTVVSFIFSGDSVSGNQVLVQPFFRTAQLPPKGGCAYSTGKQTFTATLGAPAAR